MPLSGSPVSLSTRLSYLKVQKFRVVVGTPKPEQSPPESLCPTASWHCAGYFGFGLASLEDQIRFGIEDARPDNDTFSERL